MEKNFISILITNYNKGIYLNKTIKSCLKQNFLNKEILVFDDCSSDNSVEILKKYKKEKKILFGGTFSKKKLKISPTILRTKLNETDILQKELFSSLLPVVGINDKESALKQISQTSKPLAIYLFGGNKKIHNHISKVTSSGTICINDVMLPVLIPNLPFGGVGQSGIGKFHGEEGFRNFSNQKSITFKGFLFDSNLRYPPYKRVKKFLKFIFQV